MGQKNKRLCGFKRHSAVGWAYPEMLKGKGTGTQGLECKNPPKSGSTWRKIQISGGHKAGAGL
jgi:hypothetical protein